MKNLDNEVNIRLADIDPRHLACLTWQKVAIILKTKQNDSIIIYYLSSIHLFCWDKPEKTVIHFAVGPSLSMAFQARC